MRTQAEVKHAFSPVTKLTEGQKQRLLNMEVRFKELASDIIDQVPDCADRTSALRKVLEAKFNCSQAITHQPSAEAALVKNKTKPAVAEGDVNVENQT